MRQRQKLLKGLHPGFAIVPHPAFFQYDFALFFEFDRIQLQIAHSVCLELETDPKPGFFKALEICSIITSCKGILPAAVFRDNPRKVTRGMILGPLEHHVFENMGYTGNAFKLGTASNLVPSLLDNDGSPKIFLDQHFQPIFQNTVVHRRTSEGKAAQQYKEEK